MHLKAEPLTSTGATVAERLACSPPTKTIRVQSPARLHVGIVLDDAVGRRVFSGISRFPLLSFRGCSILTSLFPHRLPREGIHFKEARIAAERDWVAMATFGAMTSSLFVPIRAFTRCKCGGVVSGQRLARGTKQVVGDSSFLFCVLGQQDKEETKKYWQTPVYRRMRIAARVCNTRIRAQADNTNGVSPNVSTKVNNIIQGPRRSTTQDEHHQFGDHSNDKQVGDVGECFLRRVCLNTWGKGNSEAEMCSHVAGWRGSSAALGDGSREVGSLEAAAPHTAFDMQKQGSDKGDSDILIKCSIASKRKALNRRALFTSYYGKRSCYEKTRRPMTTFFTSPTSDVPGCTSPVNVGYMRRRPITVLNTNPIHTIFDKAIGGKSVRRWEIDGASAQPT
ncbi:hypothetical protein PR048_000949 [Dryococelus australis]|uniref:Uncharacterized protein n=1 Tax=Dryococelus australis TaxID=614101 RepID=A0ABQ9IIF3_9NEOP|nr:hypothetical protein PR048_000949 [Dryococelus australis]